MPQLTREIRHPGPVAAQRHQVAPATLCELALTLEPGRSLLAAVREALDAAAQARGLPAPCRSAVLRLGEPGRDAAMFPFAWVMPARAKTPAHAVYFSDRFDAAQAVRLRDATVTYGQREGQPFLHCHADWLDAQGQRRCGHVLPTEAVLTEPMPARAWLLQGAGFEVRADAETAFSLFQPVADGAAGGPGHAAPAGALAVRLAPNTDVCLSLEALCRAHGIRRATVRGGVGSTVGAVFNDGRVVEPFVTETLVRAGRIAPEGGRPDGELRAELDVSLVDHTGGLADGRLARGRNPVLVTFELVLEADQ
ncbi:DNA-binding protein [Aquabacterium sp. OR-4]|uniref:DNA-binding protein n=1 Tax=Aquabacterium sp. OR-4 TaxID=2978127 RepID=UPI0021B2C6D6|nr:DNA-binding protein [Aquabacterium sp. OR-4]MDT7835438.1 DNA-binding protein [Aquabacterium sp. OR-4]